LNKITVATKAAKENQRAQDVRVTSLTVATNTANATYAMLEPAIMTGESFK